MKKPSTSPKPILPIQKTLRHLWIVWLLYRLFGYPALVGIATGANVVLGVLWQLFVLLPAFGLTAAVLKARSPYALMVASMLALVYLATVGVFLLVRLYENAPMAIWAGFAAETLLLLAINWYLLVLLKRLPPMHKTSATRAVE